MKPFKDRPIKSKLTIFILLSTFLAVSALSSVFMLQRYTTFKSQISDEFTTITKIIADRSNAAILFEDQSALSETLASLALHSDVLIACTYNLTGDLLASYSSSSKNLPSIQSCPNKPHSDQLHFRDNSIDISEPIVVEGSPAGTVFVSSSTAKLKAELHAALFNMLVLSTFILIAAWLFARYIQRFITDPLIELKDAAREIGLTKLEFSPLDKKIRTKLAN